MGTGVAVGRGIGVWAKAEDVGVGGAVVGLGIVEVGVGNGVCAGDDVGAGVAVGDTFCSVTSPM